jgi:hypothetical protein
MAESKAREYELVLLGATGYTGKLCAEHITLKLPTNLKWAVGGRSSTKLSAMVEELRSLNPDRLQPGEFAIALWSGRGFNSSRSGGCKLDLKRP